MTTVSLPRTGRRLLMAAVAAALTVSMAACGGAAEKPADGKPASGLQDSFPVRVEHKFGATEVKKKPERVVTLGLSDHDSVLALGVKPVGVIDWFKERPYGKWPWLEGKWDTTPPEIVGERDEYNMEKIASLRPDLIIAQYSGMKKEQYETLTKLGVPVVAQSAKYEDYAAPWQEMTRMVAKALGQETKGNELITGVEQNFARIRKEHPQFQGKTVIVADNDTPGNYVAFAAHDPKTTFMTEIGFKVPQKVAEVDKKTNIIEVASEGLELFEVDRLLWLTSSPDAEQKVRADPLYNKLKVVGQKRDLFVPYENPPIGAAISFNTVLSIPYAVQHLLPLLTAAPK